MGEGARPLLLLEEASVAEEQPLCYVVYSPRALPPRSILATCFHETMTPLGAQVAIGWNWQYWPVTLVCGEWPLYGCPTW